LAVCAGLMMAAAVLVSAEMMTPKSEAELDAAHEWAEPEYSSEPSLLETSGKLRGIPVTVHPRKGMVTYISPAKRVQPMGFMFQAPPSVQVVHSHPPPPTPIVVTPIVRHHTDHHHVLPVVTPAILEDVPYWSEHDHFPHGHDHHDMDWVNGRVLNMHRHHHRIHPRTSGPIHVRHMHGHEHRHVRRPFGVPAALFNQPVHRPHYGHEKAISQGTVTVPAGPVAVEGAGYSGYNRGPAIQRHSAPTAYWSDGTPHAASMTQYG